MENSKKNEKGKRHWVWSSGPHSENGCSFSHQLKAKSPEFFSDTRRRKQGHLPGSQRELPLPFTKVTGGHRSTQVGFPGRLRKAPLEDAAGERTARALRHQPRSAGSHGRPEERAVPGKEGGAPPDRALIGRGASVSRLGAGLPRTEKQGRATSSDILLPVASLQRIFVTCRGSPGHGASLTEKRTLPGDE